MIAESHEPALLHRLHEHFREDPGNLSVVEQSFQTYERPNLQIAATELISELSPHLFGIVNDEDYRGPSLAKLARPTSSAGYDEGPVQYIDVLLPGDQRLTCVKQGLYLFRRENEPFALLVAEELYRHEQGFKVEVMARTKEQAEDFLRQLTKQTRYGSAYRGHILSFERDCYGRTNIEFHQLPQIRRDDVILPEELLLRLERHTLTFTRYAGKLRAAKRHLKRGLLLHGPPGTGKTLSAMYLVSQMPGRTVVLLTGGGMGIIESACKLARLMQPATVILEDVDLIGTERNHQTVGANALLFELLNQMDGLADDADVLFILTTNRPEILEPALTSRPGRIDQALEIPPPDADCRRRLFELYGEGLRLEVTDWHNLVERTNGVSGAFIKELLRKAAVFAAEEQSGDPLRVQDRHLEAALTELVVAGGALTQSLLGVTRRTDA